MVNNIFLERRIFLLETINYRDIAEKNLNKNFLLIDLRTPSEYEAETIPGAINIPIFSDEEREEIGKTYKNISVGLAKEIGLEKVSQKLPRLYKEISQLEKEHDNLVFFCARGGMRSRSLVALLRSLNVKASKIENGYKGYRQYINEDLPRQVEEIEFYVLYGNTGSGKTEILKMLGEKGIDTLDLEGCANHRGSTLGSVGLGKQNSQKMFESLLYDSLKNRKSNRVFVEGESKRIGRDIIPDYLFKAIKEGHNIKIITDLEKRIDNILKDYVHDTDDEIIESLDHMRKHMGNQNVDRLIDLIKEKNYREAIKDLMEKYYDPLYEHNIKEYEKVFNYIDHGIVNEIINWLGSESFDK